MELLGNLGIDIKLLVAQIINFGLLLWLLTRFFYKPIVKRIEKDEEELRQAQIQKQNLEQEKNDFAEQEKKEIARTKKRTKDIIEQAENIAKEISKETHKKASNDAKAFTEQSIKRIENLRPEIEREILKKIQSKVDNSIGRSFKNTLPVSLQKEFQDILWKDFIKQTEELTLKKIRKIDMEDSINTENEEDKKNIFEKRLDGILSKKIGHVMLEYVYPPNHEQLDELDKIISKKIGLKIKINKKQNKSLINGLRFEINGMIVESNLLNIIKHATN